MELGLVAASGWAAGLNVYAVVLILGLVGRFADAPVPSELTTAPVLVGAAVLYLVEFVADKVPYLDNVWDMVHTIIRPIVAGVIGYLLAGESGLNEALGAGSASVLALVAHSTKATTRAAVNVSPEPVSNISLSVLEDGIVAGLLAVALANPVVGLVLVAVLVVVGTWLVLRLWRALGRLRSKLSARWAEP